MDVLLIGINSKFIHPNVAIRLIKKNSIHNVNIKEFTIKDNNQEILVLLHEMTFCFSQKSNPKNLHTVDY